MSSWTEVWRTASVASARSSQKKLQLCSPSSSTASSSTAPYAACSTCFVGQQRPLLLSLLPTTLSRQQAAHMLKERDAEEASADDISCCSLPLPVQVPRPHAAHTNNNVHRQEQAALQEQP